MRILILTHARSGGMSFMKYIRYELGYTKYHEPFMEIGGDSLSNEDINTKLLVDDNIVVKDFPFNIINRGYDLNDIISKFDKVIIHHRGNRRDVGISLAYFQYGYGTHMHKTYKVTDEWVKDNKDKIELMLDHTNETFNILENLNDEKYLKTSYEGIYNDKSDIPRLLKYLNINDALYLDILNNKRRLRNGEIGMENVKIKPKLI
jgi:hypothetical protein